MKNQTNYSTKSSSLIKFLLLIFIIINIISIFTTNTHATVMNHINYFIWGFAMFGNIAETILSLSFFLIEFVLIVFLFFKKSKYKLILNIILEILCVTDICICVVLLISQTYSVECVEDVFIKSDLKTILENSLNIILDLIFILLIAFDIIITYKKPIQNTNIDTLNQ